MTFGSLFSGIGGMDLGLERAGMQCKWQVEIDPFCQKVLAKHWPNVKRYGDIRAVDGNELERVDLIAGGFPCQDVSQIGLRRGTSNGTRSGLYRELLRIAGDVRPGLVLMENVTGLLVDGIGFVLSDLARMGLDAEWGVISACTFGAPHMRERVFIVANTQGEGRKTGRLFSGAKTGFSQPAHVGPEAMGAWATEPGICGVVHGLTNRMDRVKGLGNAVVPQVAQWIGERIMQANAQLR